MAVYSPWDTRTHQPIDPSYGRLRFKKATWGQDSHGDYQYIIDEIKSHPCTDEDFETNFWPMTNELQDEEIKEFFAEQFM